MPFDWQDYLTLAEGLVGMTAESAKRSAISRAYYAAFHRAEAIYSSHHTTYLRTRGTQSHYDVWNWFESQAALSYKKIGTAGKNLKRRREDADHREEFPGIAQQAVYQIAKAREIIQGIDRVSTAPSVDLPSGSYFPTDAPLPPEPCPVTLALPLPPVLSCDILISTTAPVLSPACKKPL